MMKSIVYIMYSHKRHYIDSDNWYYDTKIHGIFTEEDVSKYRLERKKANVKCMIVPLNKFVESGVEL